MRERIEALRRTLGAVLVGQEQAVTALILALLAREHGYLEGPPGCGKTKLAQALGQITGARTAALRCHRDTGPAELLGDTLLTRRAHGSGQRIARELQPGPLLQAEVAVLDDLSRAPGEALAPLLRILAERRALGAELPLECAIATGLPDAEDVYADPLEPTQLDRFAIQVRMRGLASQERWASARGLLDLACAEAGAPMPVLFDTKMRHALQAQVAALPVSVAGRAGLLRAVERLRAASAAEQGALLTDRAFGRAALRIMRAHAALRGSPQVEVEDLRALVFMLARRVPESVLSRADALIAEVIAEGEASAAAPATWRPGAVPTQGAGASGPPQEPAESESDGLVREPAAVNAAARSDPDAAEVDALLRALAGRLDRGAVEHDEDPGGQPRSYRRMRRLDEILDADPIDAVLLAETRLPGVPRVYKRARRNAGGTLAVLRDVSASMEGRLSRWAGQVVAGLIKTCARRHMRVGYVEFNHEAERHAIGGRFFHRRYRHLLSLAARRRAEGRTSYQEPLRSALADFRGAAGRRNRHILLLTDGVPVLGDPEVRKERALARKLGVRVHTVFLGLGDCPAVLDDISAETGGLCFVARPRPGGRLSVSEREARCETN